MKKAIGQTVRDLKREVNKKVLKVPGIEQKILDATSNEPWGPHGSAMAELAHASRNFHDYQLIMAVIWKRINDTGKKWRHVNKALTVLEYLVAHGSERVIDEIKDHSYQLSTLANFHYIDSKGRNQGSNIRKKSQGLVALVSSKERIQEIRQKSQSAKEKHQLLDGERYARDNCGEDGGRGSVGYQTRSGSQSVDRYSERSFDDDDHGSSRGLERKLSGHSVGASPSYEEATKDAHNSTEDERNGDCETAPTPMSSSSTPSSNSPSENTGEGSDKSVSSVVASPKNEFDAFNLFDPRGSVSGAMVDSSSPVLDIFGLSAPDSVNPLAVVPATSTTTFESNLHSDLGSGTNFDTLSSTNNTNLPSENPFGDPPFKAIPQEDFPYQPQNFQVVTSFQPSGSSDSPDTLPSATKKVDSFPGFNFGDALGGLTYAPVSVNGEHSSAGPPFLASELSGEQSSNDILDSILPRTGSGPPFSSHESQPALSTNMQTAEMYFPSPSDQSAPAASQGFLSSSQIAQMNPFQFSGFSGPVPAQVLSTNAETAQMNPFHIPGLSAPVGSKEVPTNSENYFLPSSGVLASATSLRPPTNIQVTQGNFLQSSRPSVPAASQGSATNMQTSEMNILRPAGLSASASPQGPQTNIQSAEMNFFQPPRPSASAAPQGPHAIMQQAHMNFFQPSGFSAPVASTAPTNMQATQSGAPNDMSSAHLNLGCQSMLSDPLASPCLPTNIQATQGNFLQSSASSVPASSQGSTTNMQPSEVNTFQQSGLSAPAAPQGPQTNMQSAGSNFFQPPRPSSSAAPQGSQASVQQAHMNFFSAPMDSTAPPNIDATQPGDPNGMQSAHLNVGSQSMLSGPLASQGEQALAPTNMQATQHGVPTNMHTTQSEASTNMQATQSGVPTSPQGTQSGSPTNPQGTQSGAPTSPQGTRSGAPTNPQGTQSGAPTSPQGSQSGAPTSPQGTQSGAPTNMQTANLSPVTQLMSSDPLGSKTAQPTGLTYMHVTGPPANMQAAHPNLDSRSTLSDPLASQRAQASAPNYMQATQFGAPANIQTSQLMLPAPFVSQATPALAGTPAKLPSKEKFEPKSTVWADTMSRGLVNFNISGPKTNPLDDIGVDFDAINRKEKRLEARSSAPPVASAITMGKAMGSGSGLGRAGGGGYAPSPNPMMGSGMNMGGMGMGMAGGGGGMGMGMGMNMGMGGSAGMGMSPGMNMGGYGANMSQPPMGMMHNMGMGMGQGAPGQPPTGMQPPQGPGMPGSGHNPMTGMGGYGRQQPYGGGYR